MNVQEIQNGVPGLAVIAIAHHCDPAKTIGLDHSRLTERIAKLLEITAHCTGRGLNLPKRHIRWICAILCEIVRIGHVQGKHRLASPF